MRRSAFPREDKPARLRQLAKNGEFFGAPVGLFFCLDRKLGPPQWADLGMFMQNVMLLAVERGLDTCPQEYWARYPKTVAEFLGLPDDHMLFAGMALGYRDDDTPDQHAARPAATPSRSGPSCAASTEVSDNSVCNNREMHRYGFVIKSGIKICSSASGIWSGASHASDEYGLSLFAADVRDDLSRFHLLHYGDRVDGFLISGHNSGTHWLRFMLSAAIANRLDLPRPAYSSGPESDVYIGHARHRRRFPRRPGSAARTICPRG